MTSSFGRTEVPHAVLLAICYWSPVSRVVLVFISLLKVHLSHSYVFLHSVSKLTIVSRPPLLLNFFPVLFSAPPFVFLFLFHLQHVLSKFDHFPELCLVSRCRFSFLLSSHPHSTFFPLVFPSVTSVSQSQSCSSSAFPEEAVHKDYRVLFSSSISAAARLYHAAL